jgi:hypothetical protein
MSTIAITNNGLWGVALIIGLIAALVVAALLATLVKSVTDIDRSATALLGVAGQVANNTGQIPKLQATAPVLGEIIDEALVQDRYMNALTDGFGQGGDAA